MQRKTIRILLLEPHAATRHTMHRALDAAGFQVSTATTGAETLLACGIDTPEIFVLELHVPDMDGFELIGRVRHEMRETDPVIIVTAEPDDDMTRAYLVPMVDFVGGDYFFAKPCDGKLLVGLLEGLSNDRCSPSHHLVKKPHRPKLRKQRQRQMVRR